MHFNPSTVEDLRSKFTAEPGYSAFGELMGGGGVSTCLDTRNTDVDRSRIPLGDANFLVGKREEEGRASLIILIHPSSQSFSWNQAIRKVGGLFESLKASIDLAPLTF